MASQGDDDPAQAASLADRIAAGDATAEDELVARYRPGVALLLRKLVKDPALADDLCQEVLRIALQALRQGRLSSGEKIAAYLWGIARNLAQTERRRQVRHPHVAWNDEREDAAGRPDHQLLQEERARLVRQALNALSSRDRAVLGAYYLHDTPKPAICSRLGLTPAQFDVIKWRALKRMLAIVQRSEERRNG